MKKIIKISCTGSTKAAVDHSNPMIFKFLPDRKNIWKNCEFFWNDDKIKKADYWIIIGDVDLDEEECTVPFENIIFMTGEPESIKRYDVSAAFTSQFGRIYTSQINFKHPKVFPCRPPINWWIDGGSPIKTQEEFALWKGDGLSYNDFKNLKTIKKDKFLSVFCSNKIFTAGHKMRFEFCQKLKKHFKDKIDWFGAGVQPIASKYDGIAPYKYHITLENSSSNNYITEKLLDPLMVLTCPIYHGAPNIAEYFSSNQVVKIDIRYPKSTIAKIEGLLDGNFYEKNLKNIIAARDLVMDKYNLFNLISDIVENDKKLGLAIAKSGPITVKKEQLLLLQNNVKMLKLKASISQRIYKSLMKRIVKIRNYCVDLFLLALYRT